MVEIWKDVVGYEGLYQVSNFGQIRSLKNKNIKILSFWTLKGYFHLKLWKYQRGKVYSVHRIVGNAFIHNPYNKPEINHIDGIKTNNRVDNLEWVTRKENAVHASKTGLLKCGEKCIMSKLKTIQVLEIRRKYKTGMYTQQNLADEYKVSVALIYSIINRKIWKHI